MEHISSAVGVSSRGWCETNLPSKTGQPGAGETHTPPKDHAYNHPEVDRTRGISGILRFFQRSFLSTHGWLACNPEPPG